MYYIGIDLGGTNIAVGLVDENGKIVNKGSVPTQNKRHYKEILKDMAMLSIKVTEEAGIDIKDVHSIGIGSPGTPDSKNGILIYSNNLNFRNVPIREEIQKYINIPVFLENDANCAALAESVAGAAKGCDNSITITLGTGVGSGVVINKKIYSGFNYAAAEIGHTVIVVDGEECTCGRKGCFEAYASATGLIRQTKAAVKENPSSLISSLVEGDLNKIDAKVAFDAAKMGDDTGIKIIKQYIKYLAVGIINVINTFQPEILVIGGGICKQGEYLLEPLREEVSKGIYSKDISQTQIRAAIMENDAGIVGAAMLGI